MFTSYAQNFEDVILWRALGHVPRGSYIDIGAQDPITDSVSRGFYERGWRGVHVEPSARYAADLRRDRPDEIVIEAAIWRASGTLEMYEFPNTGLSTAIPEIAREHRRAGRTSTEVVVRSLTLSELLSGHQGGEVHWLKIDVEGAEADVIGGWLPSAVRPWIVLVEATAPLSTRLTHRTWEQALESLGYTFAYFDGVNRFYVHDDHRELMGKFGPGPNIFDEFQLSRTSPFAASLSQELALIEAERASPQRGALERSLGETRALVDSLSQDNARLGTRVLTLQAIRGVEILHLREAQKSLSRERGERVEITSRADALDRALANATSDAERIRAHLAAVLASSSWRGTAPLRKLKTAIAVLIYNPSRLLGLLGKNLSPLRRHNLVAGPGATDAGRSESQDEVDVLASMSPRARQVMDDLRTQADALAQH